MPGTFDQTELLERVDHDLAFLDETVQMLAGDGRALMAELRRNLETGDAPAVGRNAHALKGMISNFCAPAAQQAALSVERTGKSGDLSTAGPLVADLGERLEALIHELEQFVKGAR